jgi:hypothetical protein
MLSAGGGRGVAPVSGVDGSLGGDSGGGRGRDFHVNKGDGEVFDAVFRDGGRVRLERVHGFAWERRRRSEYGHLAF